MTGYWPPIQYHPLLKSTLHAIVYGLSSLALCTLPTLTITHITISLPFHHIYITSFTVVMPTHVLDQWFTLVKRCKQAMILSSTNKNGWTKLCITVTSSQIQVQVCLYLHTWYERLHTHDMRGILNFRVKSCSWLSVQCSYSSCKHAKFGCLLLTTTPVDLRTFV